MLMFIVKNCVMVSLSRNRRRRRLIYISVWPSTVMCLTFSSIVVVIGRRRMRYYYNLYDVYGTHITNMLNPACIHILCSPLVHTRGSRSVDHSSGCFTLAHLLILKRHNPISTGAAATFDVTPSRACVRLANST